MRFWKIYTLVACVWMIFHFAIFIICMLTLKREEMGKLEELYTRPVYHIVGVLTDGVFWPITIPYKLPKIVKAVTKAIRRLISQYKNNQNGSKKGEKR